MSFTLEQIKKLAELSRLALTDEECTRMHHDLSQIVGYVERLSEVDVTGIEPMTHAVPVDLRLRPDQVQPMVGRKALAGSAGYEDGFVKVPKIIE